MFARHVSMKLKANSAPEFNRIIANEIIPLLRKEKGFEDEITFIAPERSEAVAITFWATKENAEESTVIFSDGGGLVMSKVNFGPSHDLRSLQNEVNRLFSSNMSSAFADEGIARGTWNPTVDIYENKDRIVIEADLPGMNREDIHLTFGNNVLTLSGERRFEIVGQGSGESRGTRTIEAQAKKAAV